MNPAARTSEPSRPRAPRGLSPARLWALLALFTAGYFGAFAVYPGMFSILGVNHYHPWFLDTFALLASNDAVTRGLDPYAPNPLDYFHRPHVYPQAWLHLRDLGLTRADRAWLGWTLVTAFLAAALARLRPRTAGQWLWYAAMLASAPMVLAVERANNDLVIFLLLAPLVPILLCRHAAVRWLAPVLVALAAVLKYYPAVAALVLLVDRNAREKWIRLGWTVLLLGLAACVLMRDWAAHGGLAPQPGGLLSFGATALFNQLGWRGWMPRMACLFAGFVVIAAAWRRGRRARDHAWVKGESGVSVGGHLGTEDQTGGKTKPPASRSDELHFMLGAALLTGCFFAGLNYGYRWIFALWLAPWLWSLPGAAVASRGERRLAGSLRWVLLVVLWWDTLCCFVLNRLAAGTPAETLARWANTAYLAEQPLDWALFLGLLVFLTRFAQRELRGWNGREAG